MASRDAVRAPIEGARASLKRCVAALSLDISLHLIIAYLKKTPLVVFQNKTGQPAGRKCGSIHTDAIRTDLGGDQRRMTMHDEFSVLRVARQERVSDIQKIIAILLIQRHARPYAHMTEKVIADSR